MQATCSLALPCPKLLVLDDHLAFRPAHCLNFSWHVLHVFGGELADTCSTEHGYAARLFKRVHESTDSTSGDTAAHLCVADEQDSRALLLPVRCISSALFGDAGELHP